MARSLVAALTLLTITIRPSFAQVDIPDNVVSAADKAGVDPMDLAGAVVTTGMEPEEYLFSTGELKRPVLTGGNDWPIGGALGQRIYCIEGAESGHNGFAVNPSSGAAGWLQWLPSTARQWNVVIGNRWSEWHGAAKIAALGARFFRSQWVALQVGSC